MKFNPLVLQPLGPCFLLLLSASGLASTQAWDVESLQKQINEANVTEAGSTSLLCEASHFKPQLHGSKILSLTAEVVRGLSMDMGWKDEHAALSVTIGFCNVTVHHSHRGTSDVLTTYIWLPISRSWDSVAHPATSRLNGAAWNGRFMGTGGGGYVGGGGALSADSLAYAVSQGYAAIATDTGHPNEVPRNMFDPSQWALKANGEVDFNALYNFARVGVDDATVLGKSITESFYGSEIQYSYWHGCSTGGRQGLMMAQRYADKYDGILAAAPAINWAKFVPSEYWSHFIMNQLNYYPPACEMQAITAAAIEACDELDGIKDGIISAPDLCSYDATDLLDKPISCTLNAKTTEMKITSQAIRIAQASWTGAKTADGTKWWHGLSHDAPLVGRVGLASTVCDKGPESCKAAPFPVSATWIQFFIEKNPSFDPSKMSHEEYTTVLSRSVAEYSSIMSTSNPDLTDLKHYGGKVLLWHGLQDELIPPNGTVEYYERVLERDSEATDYLRLFLAPGVQHCEGGPGHYPVDALEKLVGWVEKQEDPRVLTGEASGRRGGNDAVEKSFSKICAYPLVARYKGKGADPNSAESFDCEERF